MAMDKTALGNLIKSKIDILSAEEKQQEIPVWTAVAEAIIDHIKSNAEIAALTQSGIVAGGGAGAPATITQQGATESGQTGKIS